LVFAIYAQKSNQRLLHYVSTIIALVGMWRWLL
jgi:hypothetical protein